MPTSLHNPPCSMFAPSLRALFAVFLILVSALPASAQAVRVVAKVNGDAITDYALKQRITFAIRSSGMQDSADLQQRLAPHILRQMIDERLQIQNASGLGVKPSDDEVNQRVGEIERQAGLQPGQFKQYLQGIGDAFRDRLLSRSKRASALTQDRAPQGEATGRRVGRRDRRRSWRRSAPAPARPTSAGRRDLHPDRPGRAGRRGQAQRRPRGRAVASSRVRGPRSSSSSHGATAQQGGDLGLILPGSLDPALDAARWRSCRCTRPPSRSARRRAIRILLVVDRRPVQRSRDPKRSS